MKSSTKDRNRSRLTINNYNSDPLLVSKTNGQHPRIGICGHALICLLPILGGAVMLLVLGALLYIHNITIYDRTISDALASYEPYNTVLIPVLAGATIMFVVALARNIQISVYFRRQSAYSWFMSIINFVAAVANIAAYAGFVVLVLFKIGGGGREEEIHYFGSYVCFVGNCVHAILHTSILFRQAQYPFLVKLVFLLVGAGMVATMTLFGVDQEWVEYEWIGVTLAALYVMLFAVLFHIDQVDDEIADFFCCRTKRQLSPLNDDFVHL